MNPISIADYDILSTLEQLDPKGYIGGVYLCSTPERKRVVVKVFNFDRVPAFAREAFVAEVLAHGRIGCSPHKNVCQFFEYYELTKPILLNDVTVNHYGYIAMEAIEGSTLLDVLLQAAESGVPLSSAQIEGYFNQVLAGLAHIHSLGMAHLDMKLENIVVDAEGTVKIIDFGHSQRLGEELAGQKGT